MEATLELNAEQRAAVEHPGGPLLVIAGAGSGKTRVLTARIAHLLQRGVRPESVLAFTFTNRAAREMRERIARSVGEAAQRLWVGTFHATGARILRREADRLGLPRGFAIYDREDQEDVLKEIFRRLELPEPAYRVGPVIEKISDAKNALVWPEDALRVAVSPFEKQVAECYRLYRDALRAAAALDFDDLIAETVRLLRGEPEVGARYARRFEHILVDEYQDTNHAQFRLVQALSEAHRDLFVVGDDDQSIYGWRGADLSNVLDFEAAFPGASVLRLEQNYRSTGRILGAANAVIANNRGRKGKTLWCDREDGAPLRFVLAADEIEEAQRIRAFLEQHAGRGGRLDDCAVLYRTHAQSRALETELRQRQLPYEVVGGVSFYQRREVKDLLAYLRLAVNPADTAAFWRIWNTPRRGLGAAVRALVEERMLAGAPSPLAALKSLLEAGTLTRAACLGAAELVAVVDELRARQGDPADALLLQVLERTTYLEHLDAEAGGDAEERRANVEELVAAAAESTARGTATLEDFLAEAALVSDVDRLEEGADRVLLLTAHNAKGLEFGAVVVAGLEEGLFPHGSALEDPAELEEERRLFYVALTRARDQVLLTAAAFRRRYASSGGVAARGGQVSRFVEEIPEALLTHERTSAALAARRQVGEGQGAAGGGMRGGAGDRTLGRQGAIGREVYHDRFGRGVVVEADGDGVDARYTVRFGTRVKRVLGRFLSGGSDGD